MAERDHFGKLLKAIEDCKDRLIGIVVHLNDTYLIDGREDRNIPGFPRGIATIERLRDHVLYVTGSDRLLVVHSGDFLGPSRIGKLDKGIAMVSLLNELNLQFCTLGNHEFDYKAEQLGKRLRAAKFEVVLLNVTDPRTEMSIKPFAFWPSPEDPLIALTGVVSESVAQSFKNVAKEPWSFKAPADALNCFFDQTRQAAFHVILTHATRTEDLEIRDKLLPCSRTYLLGGHDHDIHWIEDDDEPLVMKNLANCQTIRVSLLLAGGESAMAMLRKSYDTMKQKGINEGKTPFEAEPRYPTDLKNLLRAVHPIDALVLKRELTMIAQGHSLAKLPDSTPSIGMGYFSADEDDIPEDALLRHMGQLPWRKDIWAWTLRLADHEKEDQGLLNYVQSLMRGIEEPGEGTVVKDFTSETSHGLEARDECLRHWSTDFGKFVAQCVRLKGSADIAILNAGSFRCDSQLPNSLRVRDLRETFLYDSDETIIVLELKNETVNALLQHGFSKQGTGAYPQVADHRQGAKATARVALASYLVTDEESIDGYDGVLARELGIDKKAVWAWAKTNGATCFGIVNAIQEQASQVEYPVECQSSGSNDDAIQFINLVTNYIDVFDQKIGLVVGRDDKYTQPERDRMFRSWLASDESINDAQVRVARDKVRTFLRNLSAVLRCVTLMQSKGSSQTGMSGGETESGPELLAKARDQLMTLCTKVSAHPWGARDKRDYRRMFELAANGMSGWIWDHRLVR